VLALVAGSFLVHEAGYAFDQFWIIASYILWATAISVGWGRARPAQFSSQPPREAVHQ
jgi:uncharacterized membrane protein